MERFWFKMVSFAALIATATGQVLMEGSCPLVPVFKSFKPEKFLGTWYEIERYYSDFQVNSKCNKIDFTSNHDGRIAIVTTALQEKSGMPKVAYGLANFEYGDSAKMTISLTPSGASSKHRQYGYWVLDTDYESYAVVYSCEDFCRGRQHAESMWVLGRTAVLPSQVTNRIYDRIKIMGLDPKRLIKVDQSKCVHVAVSVRSEHQGFSRNTFDRNSARKFLDSLTNVFGRSRFNFI
ncbi:Apolipoprotein D [Orchesella cincta]|uniref:Apolipoprotein D n=1 Tax=Orchesella cincta TaxID=48709 RepID=A0A1D2MVQ6_ORCCI|nr:Apolipoprotein D [Orchesella cincta]